MCLLLARLLDWLSRPLLFQDLNVGKRRLVACHELARFLDLDRRVVGLCRRYARYLELCHFLPHFFVSPYCACGELLSGSLWLLTGKSSFVVLVARFLLVPNCKLQRLVATPPDFNRVVVLSSRACLVLVVCFLRDGKSLRVLRRLESRLEILSQGLGQLRQMVLEVGLQLGYLALLVTHQVGGGAALAHARGLLLLAWLVHKWDGVLLLGEGQLLFIRHFTVLNYIIH